MRVEYMTAQTMDRINRQMLAFLETPLCHQRHLILCLTFRDVAGHAELLEQCASGSDQRLLPEQFPGSFVMGVMPPYVMLTSLIVQGPSPVLPPQPMLSSPGTSGRSLMRIPDVTMLMSSSPHGLAGDCIELNH